MDDASGWSTSRPVARVGRGEAPAVARPNTNAEAPRGVCSRDTRLDRVRVDDRDGRNASVPQLGCARQTRRSRGPRVRTRGNDETRIFQNAQARRCPRTFFSPHFLRQGDDCGDEFKNSPRVPPSHLRARSKSGRAAACLAIELGANVVGVDVNEKCARLENDASVLKSASQKNAGAYLRTELGAHLESTFFEADLIVLSPGVPLTHPLVASAMAQQSNTEVISELAFAARIVESFKNVRKIAVTGTNGKSTICCFCGQFLKNVAGSDNKVFVGGNYGVPLSICALDFLSHHRDGKPPPYKYVVCELSSYQLEHPGWRGK